MENQSSKLYAGIDLHRKYAYVTVMNKEGTIYHQGRYQNRDETLIPALLQLKTPLEATVESTYGWYWLADRLHDATIPLMLAHPKKVNAIVGKKKTDKEDSQALADLLRTNLLPRAYIPTPQERSLKELLRFRMHLVCELSMAKHRLHDILAKQNIDCPYSDILGKRSKAWLTKLACPYPYQDEIESLLTLSVNLGKEITLFTLRVKDHVKDDTQSQLLLSIPGVGDILALTLSTEIGEVTRFASDRALASYAGVVPSVRSSGDKTHYGGVSKQGNPYIRWALAEALPHLIRHDEYMRHFYERLKERKGGPTARVAVMNRMIRCIYAVLIKQKPYTMPKIHTDQGERT